MLRKGLSLDDEFGSKMEKKEVAGCLDI